jgi:hypothetical protein
MGRWLIWSRQSHQFCSDEKIKIKVWSPKAGIIVKLKLEKKVASDATNIEVDATSTIANGWEELTFDFPGIVSSNNYQRVVVFFDFGQKEQELLITLMILNNLIKNIKDEKNNYKHNPFLYCYWWWIVRKMILLSVHYKLLLIYK